MPLPSNPNVATLTGGTYMRTARRQIPYVMLHNNGQGYSEEGTPSVANSGYDVLVDWKQSNEFLVDVIGSHTNNGTSITRYDPEPHAFWPGLYCMAFRLHESLGVVVTDPDVAGALSYDYAAYHLTFAPLTYRLVSDTIAQQNGEIQRYVTRPPAKLVGENIQINAQLKFVSDGTVIPTPPTYKGSYIEFTLIQELVPDPIANILNKAQQYMNTVNVVPFGTQDDMPMSVGTVLYLGIGERERIPWSIGGTVLWRIPHHFIFRAQGWNVALRMSASAPPAQWGSAVAFNPASPGTTWPPYYANYDFKRLFEVAAN